MGNHQVSNVKSVAEKWGSDSKKNGGPKVKIGILAFEVANVMSKVVQLWQSLRDQEMHRLRTEVIKSEGAHHLISDNETILLEFVCIEKLQDLTSAALAIARLGKRCQERALQGFEHVYDDVLKRNINARELEFPRKEMEGKMKKMERYIMTTSSLYQELEVLAEMEQALQRAQDEDDPVRIRESIHLLEQKLTWQKQEIKYLKEISLWSRTYDKIIGLLARAVCTSYVRILDVFDFLFTVSPEALSKNKDKIHYSTTASLASTNPHEIEIKVNDSSSGNPIGMQESYKSLSFCFSPGRQFARHGSFRESYQAGGNANRVMSSQLSLPLERTQSIRSNTRDCPTNSPTNTRVGGESSLDCTMGASTTGLLISNLSQSIPGSFPFMKEKNIKLLLDPKSRGPNAYLTTTLGDSALDLHYANIVIVVERMVRNPHLIGVDSREDLYQMLPESLRAALSTCLRRYPRRACSRLTWGGGQADSLDWRDNLEKLLAWLVPLAHNTIRYQSEHNIEQQNVALRANVLLIQTLYFADQQKAETAITELIVGLHHLWKYECDIKASTLIDCASERELDECLEWRLP